MSATADTAFDPATLERFADLAVTFGANLQRGQTLVVSAELGKETMVRAIAASAYRHGAKFVDPYYYDMHVKRARILHADEDTLDFVPSWYGQRLLELGRQRCARISLAGPSTPGLLDDLDPRRAGRDQLPFLKEAGALVNARTTNWTIVPYPTVGWARQVHPALPDDEALARLSEQILHVCRLDEDDPVAAWRERADLLAATAERLTQRRFDAVRFNGPGTDLTVGLLPTSKFMAARFETVDGIEHMPNLPSEEVFGAPDPQRTDGVVRATKPLVVGGSIIEGLEVEFRAGRAVRIDADENAEVLRAYAARDEGAARLGEVALVDREGRIGRLDTVFFDTLLDENAASHIALGESYGFTAGEEDQPRLNHSSIHVDFMIGGDDVAVTGIAADGGEAPILRGGAWQL
ncbi:MAG: aminopeptidase [Solirubrobacteraceae bacterium]|jgi:aminopeptidase|nr:aminopeptidase [Solirubrobacteraceae bacterium]MEA2359174.1 aminopeptidase [Solirubrobacteraceae bacterium]